jgi:hypothetical protein
MSNVKKLADMVKPDLIRVFGNWEVLYTEDRVTGEIKKKRHPSHGDPYNENDTWIVPYVKQSANG